MLYLIEKRVKCPSYLYQIKVSNKTGQTENENKDRSAGKYDTARI